MLNICLILVFMISKKFKKNNAYTIIKEGKNVLKKGWMKWFYGLKIMLELDLDDQNGHM